MRLLVCLVDSPSLPLQIALLHQPLITQLINRIYLFSNEERSTWFPTTLQSKVTTINCPILSEPVTMAQQLLLTTAVRSDDEFYALYLQPDWKVTDWAQLFNAFTNTAIEATLTQLNSTDVIGDGFTAQPEPHYQGNWWWSTSRHLRRLPAPVTKQQVVDDMTRYLQPTFDPDYYRQRYPDLRHLEAPAELVKHWLDYGKEEKRQGYDPADEHFDWQTYRELNPDLAHMSSGDQLLQHWRDFGKKEGRSCQRRYDQLLSRVDYELRLWICRVGDRFV